ncbi:hypothetical protein SODG_006259 [Sodalis praecaptivus]
MARGDIDGADLFALVGALAWFNDQPSLAPRVDHLFNVIANAILLNGKCSNALVNDTHKQAE